MVATLDFFVQIAFTQAALKADNLTVGGKYIDRCRTLRPVSVS